MENKKKLQINCAICDTRNITEEILSAYEAVQINAATLVTSPEAQALLGRYRVCVNTAGTAAISGDARFSLVNGPMTIGASSAVPEEKLYVVVNAPLTIESGCEAVLRSYAGMTVNGPVTCPESMSGLLSAFQINGPIRTYPDGGILLKKTAVLDRFFHLRTKQDALYCAPGRVIALAPDIDFARMAEKNVRFVTKELLVSESYAEAAVAMARVAGLSDENKDVSMFKDGDKIAKWAQGGVNAAQKAGLINGYEDGTFRPKVDLTREQGAALLARNFLKDDEPENPDDGDEPSNPDDGDEPSNPDDGDEPSNPDEGDEPSNPDEGSEPSNPDEGSEPSNPDEGGDTSEPSTPDEGGDTSEPTE